MKRILVATDAWDPQINGVVRSLQAVAREAPAHGAELSFLTPEQFHSFPMPTYPDIRLAVVTGGMAGAFIEKAAPDFIHIATEGSIGWAVRAWCVRRKRPFTTSYHTRFPEYVSARLPVPERMTYALLRRFHNAGCGMMVTTASLRRELADRGFQRILRWTRGVDLSLFRPRPEVDLGLPRPIFLYVGRVAPEKNIEAFLDLDLPGSKVVVGDGPSRASLMARFPAARFLGVQEGEALARTYSGSDVFVFPSRTDTFGIVLLEALASGLPIAAAPVTGPLDVVGGTDVGVLDDDLRRAALACVTIPPEGCRAYAAQFTWAESARQFVENVTKAQAQFAPHAVAR